MLAIGLPCSNRNKKENRYQYTGIIGDVKFINENWVKKKEKLGILNSALKLPTLRTI
jgi:hypothetical protein